MSYSFRNTKPYQTYVFPIEVEKKKVLCLSRPRKALKRFFKIANAPLSGSDSSRLQCQELIQRKMSSSSERAKVFHNVGERGGSV